MTNRKDFTDVWATAPSAFVVDPEVDVDHPSGEGGPGKTDRGWISETEPGEWENYLLNLREVRVKTFAQGGKLPWDSDVYYKVGGLCTYLGVNYVSLSSSNKNKTPTTATTYWSAIKFATAAEYLAAVADMQNKFSVHTVAGQNVHGDDIVAIGGSYKNVIDSQVKFVSDGLVTHTNRVDNPHNDTAIGTGTIPSTGGSFTGRVNYLQNLSLGTNCELMTSISTFVSFRSNAGAIGLGVADYSNGGRWQAIFTAASFPSINQTYNPSFKLPLPDLHFTLKSHLAPRLSTGSLTYTRPGTLAYIDKNNTAQTAAANFAPFEVNGLKLAANTSLIVDAPGLFGARDGCISYTLNNVVVVKDVQFTSADLVYYFGTSGNVQNFRVWSQRLTPRQKLSIPR